jgi:hypothetical protein
MKKFITILFLGFFWSASSIANEIIGYCLVTPLDFSDSNLPTNSQSRFLGNEIILVIDTQNKSVKNISDDKQTTLLTGLDKNFVNLTVSPRGFRYSSEVDLTTLEKKIVKYKYNSLIVVKTNSIEEITSRVDSSELGVKNWKFKFSCRNNKFTLDEKNIAKNPKLFLESEKEKLMKMLKDLQKDK